MNIAWKKPLILLAVLAALVVAGCGGDDEGESGSDEPAEATSLSADEYAAKLPEILAPLATELQAIGTATSAGTSNEAAIEGVTNASETLQGGIDELAAIGPPEEAVDAHAALISSLESFRDACDEFATLDVNDEAALQEGLTTLQDSVLTFQTDFQAAIADLDEAGITPEAPAGT